MGMWREERELHEGWNGAGGAATSERPGGLGSSAAIALCLSVGPIPGPDLVWSRSPAQEWLSHQYKFVKILWKQEITLIYHWAQKGKSISKYTLGTEC